MSAPGLFSDATLQSAKLVLSGTVARHEALAANIANVNTPGYRRVDLSESFTTQLNQALEHLQRTRSAPASLPRPEIAPDLTPRPIRFDGNNVSLDHELTQLIENSSLHEFTTELLRRRYSGLRMAITGRSQQ
jgi:flagellar basal-body rod protein FlgB